MIKLCVGVDSVEELSAYHRSRLDEKARQGEAQELVHVTRMTPRRKAEILDGGSLYWVIRRVILVRQRILELRPLIDRQGKQRCAIVLAPKLVAVMPRRRRPFQGWRYLEAADAPQDVKRRRGGQGLELPPALRAELMELGVW